MKLIKWILSHGVLIIIVVLVALGIYFRADLFPEYFAQREAAPAQKAVAQPEARPAPAAQQPVAEPRSTEEVRVVVPPAAGEATVAEAPPTEEATVAEAPPSEEATVAEAPSAEATTVEAASRAQRTAPTTPAAAEAQPATTQQAPEPAAAEAPSAAAAAVAQPEPSPAESSVAEKAAPEAGPRPEPTPTPTPLDAMKLGIDARQAFWRGDYDQAAAHYERLAALKPQDPNPYGELGNVYFGQGKWSEAAAAYLEAGKRLVAIGRIGQAMHLQRIMVGLDAERAQELQRAIDEASGTAASSK